MVAVQDQIINFIKENFVAGRKDVSLGPEESLIESGVIDSTGVLELVMFLEETFGIEIDDEELVPENLDSINNLVNFLKKKGVA
ncbi:MAG: acyl carrier protein [Spirochaetae bacterium HGW-Spirochaetae-1]|jgi:acyl carrier protein|nr:MAG: acyl carrier protein [Spirochaetae bacterium HGW-Spirochaetae-1]